MARAPSGPHTKNMANPSKPPATREANCKHCGKPFTATKRYPSDTFKDHCSKACARKAWNQQGKHTEAWEAKSENRTMPLKQALKLVPTIR